jgi:hypothetical protein
MNTRSSRFSMLLRKSVLPIDVWIGRGRAHLAGVFATTMLTHYVALGWLQRQKSSRAVTTTQRRANALQKLFDNPRP